MKSRRWLLAAVLALSMALGLCACTEEETVPSLVVGEIHTAQSKQELYELFGAGSGKTDMVETVLPDTTEQGAGMPVAGFDEADTVKTDGKYLYILDAGDLKIVSAAGADAKLLSVTSVRTEGTEDSYETGRGLYVYGSTVAVIVDAEVFDSKNDEYYTDQCHLRLYDVSDPASPKLYADFAQDGYFLQTRLHDGVVYLVSTDYKFSPEKGDERTYLPCVWDEAEAQTLPLNRVYICPDQNTVAYTVVSAVDLAQTRRTDACAFTGSSSAVFMDESGLYLARTVYQQERLSAKEGEVEVRHSGTEIKRVRLMEGRLTLTHETRIEGSVLNPYAMDVYEGNVRIVTTSSALTKKTDADGIEHWSGRSDHGSNVLILSEAFERIGAVTGFAPGKQLYSARLLGDRAYVVAYAQTGSLLTIDLSDPARPVVLDGAEAEGVSNYLHWYADGKLFGLGLSENFMLQAVMLDTSGGVPALETKLELDYGGSKALTNPRTVLISPEQALLAFPADKDYVLLRYDGGVLTQQGSIPFSYHSDGTRGVLLGDTLYICDAQAVTVSTVDGQTEPVTIPFGAG